MKMPLAKFVAPVDRPVVVVLNHGEQVKVPLWVALTLGRRP